MDVRFGNGAGGCCDVQERVDTRVCEMCNGRAELFCKQERATLCRGCDAQVHGANAIASRHERYWLCELCEYGVAKVKSNSQGILLCNECDVKCHGDFCAKSDHRREKVGPASSQALAHQQRVNPSATPYELEEYAKLCNEEMGSEPHSSPSPAPSEELTPVPEVVNTFEKDIKLSGLKSATTQNKEMKEEVEDLFFADQVVPSNFLNDMMDFTDDLDIFRPDFLPAMHSQPFFEYGPLTNEKISAAQEATPEPVMQKPQMDSDSSEILSDESSNIADAYDADAQRVKLEAKSTQSSSRPSVGKSSSESVSTSSKSENLLQGFDLPPRISCMDDSENEAVKVEKVEEPREPRSVKVMRYKMKKERRKYSKKIRYQARKAYADIRPRFQGRFVKKSELEALRAAGNIIL